MKRWTNGLPGATTRLGAMMALRGLSASQPGCARIPMMARSIRRSWKSVLQHTAGPYIVARSVSTATFRLRLLPNEDRTATDATLWTALDPTRKSRCQFCYNAHNSTFHECARVDA